jgi:hypothetical protein
LNFHENYSNDGKDGFTREEEAVMIYRNDGTSSRPERTPVSIPVSVLIDPDTKKIRQRGVMLDISDRGLRLKIKLTLAPGDILEVTPRQGISYTERSRVRWVKSAGVQECVAGVELLNPQIVPSSAVPTVPKSAEPEQARSGSEPDIRQVVGDDRGPLAES